MQQEAHFAKILCDVAHSKILLRATSHKIFGKWASIKLIFVRKISHIFTFHTGGRQHFPFLYIGEWSGACLLVQLFTICAIRQQHPTAVSSPSAAPHISLLKTSPVDQKVFLPQMKEGTSEGGSNEPAKIATESTFLTSKVWHRSPSPHLPY